MGGHKSIGDGGVVPIMAGLEMGGCPHLKVLYVNNVGMGPQGGLASARALVSGLLRCLQDFNVGQNENVGDEAMAEVIKGLRKCHQLRELHLRETGMGVMAGQALVQALQDKAWPDLEMLSLHENQHVLSDEVVAGLVEVLGAQRTGSALPHLKVLGVRSPLWSEP